jgi:hypothetical protein
MARGVHFQVPARGGSFAEEVRCASDEKSLADMIVREASFR